MPHAPIVDFRLENKAKIMGHDVFSHAPFLPLMPRNKARLGFFAEKFKNSQYIF